MNTEACMVFVFIANKGIVGKQNKLCSWVQGSQLKIFEVLIGKPLVCIAINTALFR